MLIGQTFSERKVRLTGNLFLALPWLNVKTFSESKTRLIGNRFCHSLAKRLNLSKKLKTRFEKPVYGAFLFRSVSFWFAKFPTLLNISDILKTGKCDTFLYSLCIHGGYTILPAFAIDWY